ncbi:hypothetical protein A3D07_01810 [Candidatus Curtissbacteria bacterium RIFCSPHIGHO2_02_FULL_42_15]|uniref:PIN domain-containing protein n=1 Tax=Candidatus Curtissbacteria bacterium RIFCSPHIGHO2_02_FULL_42_15 TaxID=1797716 RepID=A0A1F5GHC1_9BACT|nr:MAG: hypothetical protein A3D07_01810 [Candidatus Curtissbacteria bacterium RIFCSPHIGHO2_02_FULL_42_15]
MIVLDTHVLIWWINETNRLSTKAQKAIENSINKGTKLLVSSISVWEIFLLFKKGSLESDMDLDVWLKNVESLQYLQFIPVDNSIAAKSVMLREFPDKDPADRIIVATARELGATLITSDARIRKYRHVQSVW